MSKNILLLCVFVSGVRNSARTIQTAKVCLCECHVQSLGYEIIPVICRLLNPEKGAGFPGQAAICQHSSLLFLTLAPDWLKLEPSGRGEPEPSPAPAGTQWRQQHMETLMVADNVHMS